MSCRHPSWRPVEWTLRAAFERLSNLSPLADTAFFRELLAKVADVVGNDAPADVVEAYARLEHAVTERGRVQARARAVRS